MRKADPVRPCLGPFRWESDSVGVRPAGGAGGCIILNSPSFIIIFISARFPARTRSHVVVVGCVAPIPFFCAINALIGFPFPTDRPTPRRYHYGGGLRVINDPDKGSGSRRLIRARSKINHRARNRSDGWSRVVKVKGCGGSSGVEFHPSGPDRRSVGGRGYAN